MKHKTKTPNKRSVETESSEEDTAEEFEDNDTAEEIPSDHNEKEVPKKRLKTDLYKAPTCEELNTLKENETLFQSSLFRLQIDELLSAVRVKDKVKALFQKWYDSFSSRVTKLKESKKFEIHNLSWLKNTNIQVPFNAYPLPHKGTFQFVPPEYIKTVGGFPFNISVKSNLCIDIACQMPKNCFQNDDCLNYCYYYKRALYLTYLAAKIKKSDLIDSLSFQYFNGDTLKPVLIIKPSGKLMKYATIRILISAPKNKFKWSKFHPRRNNIRPDCLVLENDTYDLDSQLSTQYYNNSILSDILMEDMSEYIQENLASHQGICDGIVLLKIWLHQRYLDQGYGSINGFIISMIVAYLLHIKKINPFMSSYQIVRITWLALSTLEWESEGLSLSKNPTENQPSVNEFQEYFPVVFIDPSGYYNICGNVAYVTFLRLKEEAELALKFLDIENNFEFLFMTPVPFLRKYDNVLRITYKFNKHIFILKNDLKSELFAFGGNFEETITHHLVGLLKKALGTRLLSIDVERKELMLWSVESKSEKIQTVTFGFLWDSDNSNRLLDIGPPADSFETNEFRKFWGSKSELRRFPDGNICEAVLWEGKSIAEKRLICRSIVTYILEQHAGISEEDIFYIGPQLDSLISIPYKSWPEDWPPYGTGEEFFPKIILTLDDLGKQLRTLNDLPYTLVSIQGTAASFRYTEVFPPIPLLRRADGSVYHGKSNAMIPAVMSFKSPPWIPTLDVLIKLEGENKWPDDVIGIRLTKASIYLILAKLLRRQYHLPSVAYADYVDVSKDGFVFRLKISYNREVTLLKMEKSPEGLLRFRSNEASSQLEMELTTLPKYTSIVHGIQMQYNTFSAACRLAKRWVSSQLLGDHFSEIAIELIVIYIYLFPSPYTVPRSPQVAFQRFLSILSRFDWQRFPFVINFNDEINKDELVEIHKAFTTNRACLPPVFISTPLDKFNSTWTKNCPNVQVLNYITSLAKTALEVFENQLIQNNMDFKQIFRPSYKPYDVIIHLNQNQIPRLNQSIDLNTIAIPLKYEKFVRRKIELMPVVNFDPVQFYLTELKDSYSDFAEFFHNKHGGDVVTVMWKPSAFKAQPFKVSNVSCHKLDTSDGSKSIIPNVEAIIEDFSNIGLGLVKSIEIKTEKWKID